MKVNREDTEELTKFKDLFPDIKDTEKVLAKTPTPVSDIYCFRKLDKLSIPYRNVIFV
jgi:hypothetical protein